jgi:CubicO group peptidase (beta-lactamase class C family)
METERLRELAEQHGVPGAVLALLVGDTVTDIAAGVTNRSTGERVTPDSLFQIGSITKVWTTTLVQMLVDEGRLELGAPVRTYVPELKLVDEATAEALTVQQLLNHTSGLPGDFFPDTGRGDDCLERYLGELATAELAHPLGELFSYSNGAFALAGLVIERVEGATWDSVLRRRLIEPLGLTRTVTLPEDALLHRCAVGHLGSGASQHVTPTWMLPRVNGPVGLITAQGRDVLEFARLHMAGGVTRSGARLLSSESVAAMQRLTVTMPGQDEGRLGWGLGWGLSRWSGTHVIQHDGGTIGQNAALRVLPELGVAVCLTANGGDWTPFRNAVIAEVLTDAIGLTPPPPPVPTGDIPTERPEEYVGSYRNIGTAVTVTEREGELLLAQRMLDPLESLATADVSVPRLLRARGGDAFLCPAPNGTTWIPVEFLRDAAGRVAYLHAEGRAARRLPADAAEQVHA